ncbi:MAG: antibiotic biosynthesis monooxygenase family protein [Thermomicrobiales bacterium]
MAYARIGMYTVKPGTLDAILEKAEAELVPQTRQQTGFRRYFTIRTGEDSLVSLTVWEDKEQAEQAAERLSGWVRAEVGPSLVKAEDHVGAITNASTPRGEAARYARVAVWRFNSGTDLATLTQRVKAEWIPLAEAQPGFVQHGIIQMGERDVVSVTAFASKEQATAPAGDSAAWIQENLMPSVASVERSEGAIVWDAWAAQSQ